MSEVEKLTEETRFFDEDIHPGRELGGVMENFWRFVSGISDLAYICDTDGNILYVNSAFEDLTGVGRAEAVGRSILPFVSEQDVPDVERAYERSLEGEDVSVRVGLRGTGKVCECRAISLRNPAGEVAAVVGIGRDVTGGDDMERDLRRELERVGRYLDLAGVATAELDREGRVSWAGSDLARLLGVSVADAEGLALADRLEGDSRAAFEKALERVFAGNPAGLEEVDASVVAAIPGGQCRKVRLRLSTVGGRRGGEGAVLMTAIPGPASGSEERALEHELAERKRVEGELRKLTAAIEQSGNLIFIVDRRGTVEYVNEAFVSATGLARSAVLGIPTAGFACGESAGECEDAVDRVLASGDVWSGSLRFRSGGECGEDGFWGDVTISPVRDDGGRVTGCIGMVEDMTEKRASSERLEYLTNYDGTTGLINRSRFIELLDEWIKGPGSAEGARGALFLLDIDQFKFISDSYGHGMGDEFLRRTARLLQVTVRYIDGQYSTGRGSILCRLSGDEFAVFTPGVDKVDAVVIAERVRKGVEGFYQADVPCHMTASIGAALYPEHGETTTELLTRADASMYRAKDLGRNRFHFYSPADREITEMHSRLEWKESILTALEEDRFEIWFQPIEDLATGEVKHYEVLARMRDREGGVVLPGPFIDIAERFGLVGSIGRVIVEKAMRAQVEASKTNPDIVLCVNVSGRELGDREFLYFVQSKMLETGADPARLVFEITETSAILDLERAVKSIRTLKGLGCRISLDDFGIGFTSFLYLKEMEVDYIKIAGPFIKHLTDNLNDQLFVRAITDVAGGMDVHTIAEFVEDERTRELLRSFGVDYAQGFGVGRPSPELPGSAPSRAD